ncbi:hypothetical protein C2G38_2074257 [Gigaspora rosea]|uniref:Uncharacterized protein n=1 Tax=Gigaspora rosea TaxID=44941 RepID=A0A397VLR0_9GLOM|nr:hypothetical protein C2G38_2074257 [Gigaspora rosea]
MLLKKNSRYALNKKENSRYALKKIFVLRSYSYYKKKLCYAFIKKKRFVLCSYYNIIYKKKFALCSYIYIYI